MSKNLRQLVNDFTGLIIDEAHHAPDPIGKAKQVTQLVQMARRAGLPVLGMTATPWRLSKRQGIYQDVGRAYCRPLMERTERDIPLLTFG